MLTFLDNFEFNISRDEDLRQKYADLKPVDILQNITKHDGLVYERILSEEFWDAYAVRARKMDVWQTAPRDLHYSMIDLPEYWEVLVDGLHGMISNLGEKKAQIYFFSPVNERIVKNIDWLNPDGSILRTDHFNRRGLIYARTALGLVSYQVNEKVLLIHNTSNDTVTEFAPDGHVQYIDATIKAFVARVLNVVANQSEDEITIITHDRKQWETLLGENTNVSICI